MFGRNRYTNQSAEWLARATAPGRIMHFARVLATINDSRPPEEIPEPCRRVKNIYGWHEDIERYQQYLHR